MKNKYKCPDCGPTPINHFFSKAFLYWELVIKPFDFITDWVFDIGQAFFRFQNDSSFFKRFLEFSAKINLTHILLAPDKENSDRARCLWEEAKKRGIAMKEYRFAKSRTAEQFTASFKGKSIAFRALPRPESVRSEGFYWMDNKADMRKHFEAVGLPIAKGDVCFTWSRALEIFREYGGPMITKPHSGSRSRHTVVHIMNEQELHHGFKVAKQLSPLVIVEQELKGTVHRAALIGGKLIAVLRRDFAYVIGDGKSTVKQLIERENKNPKRHGSVFHEIPIDDDCVKEIKRQGYALKTVLEKDKRINVGVKVGRGSGGVNSDWTAKTHSKNKELFEKIAKVVDDPLIGVDFIIEDVSKPWSEQMPCGIIECNSAPFLDLHHAPFEGSPVNTSGALWDIIYPGSSPDAA